MSRLAPRALRAAACAIAVPTILAAAAAPVAACGGLVGENGTIQLTRTTTLAAYHNGVERYVTSFQFTGEGKEVGSIVPLPGVPTKVERGGSWTLQRLEREIQPPQRFALAEDSASKAAGTAQVLYQTKIDALDITILKGGGKEVGTWAVSHGFLLTPDAPEVLDFYSRRSPIFMAARFDASRAKELRQGSGDGTPIMLTIPTRDPWVPLRILGLGLEKDRFVDADVFLLTDEQPKLLAGGTGLSLERNQPASSTLLDDLRSDKGMGWVPPQMWFTFLRLGTPAGTLNYDLAISAHDGRVPRLADTGVEASQAQPIIDHAGRALWPTVAAVIAGIVTFAVVGLFGRRRTRAGTAA
jgi:hypothetical protein